MEKPESSPLLSGFSVLEGDNHVFGEIQVVGLSSKIRVQDPGCS